MSRSKLGTPPHRWNNRWRARVTVGYDENGKQQRHDVYATSESECYDLWMALRKEVEQGLKTEANLSLLEFFERWIKNKDIKERTREEYNYNARHVFANLPKRGQEKLKDVCVVDVYNRQQAVNSKVSARAATKARALLYSVLNDAKKLELIARNVVEFVDPVRYTTEEYPIWSAEEVKRFLKVAVSYRYYALLLHGSHNRHEAWRAYRPALGGR